MICCVPFSASDTARAERLMDCCFWIQGQKPSGHVLLAPGADVHAEYKRKVRIAAELAFLTVDTLELTAVTGTKPEQLNAVFRQVSKYVQDCYDKPWLYLESDCVPLKPTWLSDLFTAYSQQPKRYFGRYFESEGRKSMSRVAIYPGNAHKDAGAKVSLCNSELFHIQKYEPAVTLPPSAVLLNGDRSGQLIEQLIEAAPVITPAPTEQTLTRPRGRPRRITA